MIFQLDLIIKTMLEMGLDDFKKNSWLIDFMLSDCTSNPYLSQKYGQNQIDACKEWFNNNQIDVYMRPRMDKDKPPCVCISMEPSKEKPEMKLMADQSTEKVILLPQQINKPIPYIIKPFTPLSYDIDNGLVGVPESVDLSKIAAEMILINPDSGQGLSILDIDGENILIEPGIDLKATRLAVVPKYQFYEAKIEHTFFQENCEISCYGHGDPQTTIWLHSIVLNILLRYRESLLEAQGFSESVISSGPLTVDPYFNVPEGESSYVRAINLTGQVENQWVKTPRRMIENVALREKVDNKYYGGIKILTNEETPEIVDPENESWYTVKDE